MENVTHPLAQPWGTELGSLSASRPVRPGQEPLGYKEVLPALVSEHRVQHFLILSFQGSQQLTVFFQFLKKKRRNETTCTHVRKKQSNQRLHLVREPKATSLPTHSNQGRCHPNRRRHCQTTELGEGPTGSRLFGISKHSHWYRASRLRERQRWRGEFA